MTTNLQEAAAALAPRLTEMRRELHRHPELSGAEFHTTERVRSWLAEAGIPVLELGLKTGVVAEIRGGQPGPLVALRADMDALPISEETGLDYASSVPGAMHACGHDFHTATVLGAALLLKELAPELKGTVRVLFQHAEEVATGARDFMDAGALDGVSAIFGMHNKPDVPLGYVGLRVGPLMASVDTLTITVTGKGGHAAVPNLAIDPIVAGSAIVMALQTAVSRSISPLEAGVVTIGVFQAGTVHNVIPPGAVLTGTLRAYTPAVRTTLQETVERLAVQVAAGYGCTARVDWEPGPPAVCNDEGATATVRRAAAALGLPVLEAPMTMAGEDFAEYQQRWPGCFFWMGTGCPQSWHHPRFTVDDQALAPGAALFTQVVRDLLS